MTRPDDPPKQKAPADPFITADQAVKSYDLSETDVEAMAEAGPRRRASDGEVPMSPNERMVLTELASALGAV